MFSPLKCSYFHGGWNARGGFTEETLANGDEVHLPELSFSAFALESHTGMMTVGDTTVAYTAVLEGE